MADTAKSHKKSNRTPKKANAVTNKTTKRAAPIKQVVKSKPKSTITKKWDAKYKTKSIPLQKVPICTVPKFKIYWVNTIKTSIDGPYSRHIYKIISNETNLAGYFMVPVTAKYVYFVMGLTPFIFNVDPTAKKLSSKDLEDIKCVSCQKIPIVLDTEMSRQFNRMAIFKKFGIYTISGPVSFNIPLLDLSGTVDKVAELNTILKKKCPNLSLHVDYIYNLVAPNDVVRTYGNDFPDLNFPVLCLYNEHGCISSIELEISTAKIPKGVTINSKTDTLYENKKYNKLLRCVSLLIMQLISPTITKLTSHTVNPISTYILMKYFGGRIDPAMDKDFFKWMTDNNVVLDPSNYRHIFNEYYKYAKDRYNKEEDMYDEYYYYTITVVIDINEETIKNAERLFNETVSEISCT